jgi:oligoendopeptidase F
MRLATVPALVFSTASVVLGSAQAADRSEQPAELKWNLDELYATPQAWRSAKADLARRLPALEAFKGHLGDSAKSLADALAAVTQARQRLAKPKAYASQRYDEDTRVAVSFEIREQAEQAHFLHA